MCGIWYIFDTKISHKHALYCCCLLACIHPSMCYYVYHLWFTLYNICLSTILHGYYTVHNAQHTCKLIIDLLHLRQSIKLNLSLIILVSNSLSIGNRWHIYRPINRFGSIVWLQNFVHLAQRPHTFDTFGFQCWAVMVYTRQYIIYIK